MIGHKVAQIGAGWSATIC